MDFMNRSTPPQSAHQSTASPVGAGIPGASASSAKSKHTKGGSNSHSNFFRASAVALLFALTVLVVAVIGVIYVGNTNNESKYVVSKNYQAVFLTNGQVYFGNLTNISKDYFRLQNIYYLTQDTTTDSKGTTTTNGNYTLVKLGCQQIHDPYDEMIIQRSQVSFWENLQSGQYSKVATSIANYQKTNAGKTQAQLCATTSNQTQASDTSSTQGGSSTSTGTTSGTNTTTGTTTKTP